jgi:glycosyltransferase involved in cell wall biosynthesis
MNKGILIDPILPHYRRDVIAMLSEAESFYLEFVAGEEYEGIKGLAPQNSTLFRHASFRFLGHTFYNLRGAFRYVKSKKPDFIICGGADFHLIHTILIFIFHKLIRKKRFYWWSHATLGKQGRLGFLIRKFVYRNSSGILAYNSEGRENLLRMSVRSSQIQVVNNSLNKEDYGYLNYNLINEKPAGIFTILYSGRVTEEKRLNLLIEALGELRNREVFDFICYIVGSGDLDSLQQLAVECGVEKNIVFTGSKYGKDNHKYFLQSHLYVYPGGIGLSILHAMSFGLPVLTTDDLSAHYPEIELLLPGITGDFFKGGSSNDLADKIVLWKEKSVNQRELIIERCVDRIRELGYLPEDVSHKVIEYITSQ